MLLGLECLRDRPELKNFIPIIQLEDLSMAFTSP